MVNFVFPSQRKGWVYGVRGTVIGAQKWSETEVTSSGGGGYVHPQHGGFIKAPVVRSATIQKGEIWVRTEDGKDVQVAADIPAMTG